MSVRARKRRVLVTRPRTDAGPVTAELERRGFDVLLEPLLEIRFLEGPPLALDGVQALIFTSANGVRAFARRSSTRHLPVFAVGDRTARVAGGAGFLHVESAGGNVGSLVDLVSKRSRPDVGSLLHVAGSAVAGDLAGGLSAAGLTIDRAVLYDAHTTERFSTRTLGFLQEGRIDIVLLFSPRTAQTFASLVNAAGLADACRQMTVVCLSSAVASAISGLPWQAALTAREPTRSALLAELDGVGLIENGNG